MAIDGYIIRGTYNNGSDMETVYWNGYAADYKQGGWTHDPTLAVRFMDSRHANRIISGVLHSDGNYKIIDQMCAIPFIPVATI